MFQVVSRKGRLFWAAFLLSVAAAGQTAEQAEQSQRAKELMSLGRYAEAIPLYSSLVNQIPANKGLLLNLAMAETMGGQPREAIPHCKSVLEQDTQSVPALTMLSMAHLQLNQPREAIAPLTKLVSLTPDNVDAHGMLAGADMGVNDFAGAAAQYSVLTKLAPADAKGWHGLGKAYEALASDRFDRLLKVAPQSPYVAVLLAETRLQRRQFRSAFFFYREAEKTTPELAGIHEGMANVYDSTGHRDWADTERKREEALAKKCTAATINDACEFAREHYSKLAQTKSNAPASLFWAARASNQLATDAFRRLGTLPESTELHALKAQILHDHKQELEAAKEWEAALRLASSGERPAIEKERATALFLGHDYEKAIPALEALLQADPASPDLNFMLGESLWRGQQGERAVAYLQRAIAKQPEMLPAHADLGLVLLSLNKPTEAVPHLEKAQNLDEDGSLHYSLARAYTALGNGELARNNMEIYRDIQKKNSEVNGELAKEAEITAPS